MKKKLNVKNSSSGVSDGLFDGEVGISLSLFYRYKRSDNKDLYDSGFLMLDRVLENLQIKSTLGSMSLSEGLSGLGYMFVLLKDLDLLDMDIEELIPGFDDLIFEMTTGALEEKNLGFCNGLAGVLHYFNMRADSSEVNLQLVNGMIAATTNENNGFYFPEELIYLPKLAASNPNSVWDNLYVENFQIAYIFIANLLASLATFVVLSPNYLSLGRKFDPVLWRKMMKYGLPILVAGLAFAVNEHFDKILLGYLLPENLAKSEVGAYSACYKLGLFMVLFATAFRLGIEPFFFSHAKNENAPQTYAVITKYFVIFGSLILLGVIVFADVLKYLLLDNKSYWEAMKVVPLIILANFFLGIYNNLSVWYKLTDKTKIGAYISIVGAIVTLVLNYILIPKYSYYGSAIATISAYGSMMLISYILGNKYYPIPYDMNKIGAYLGISILFSAISFYGFRENYFVGIPLLLAFIYFVYHNEKNTIKGIMNRK